MPPPRLPPVGRNLVNKRRDSSNVGNSGGGIPNEITCYVCKRKKPRSQYANRQLQRIADGISNPYAPAGRTLANPKTTCMTCAPQQVTELTCCICAKTKGLPRFSKNQRKNPETARCLKCMDGHLGTDPDGVYGGSGSEEDSEDDYSEAERAKDFDDDNPDEKLGKRTHRRCLDGDAGVIPDENTPVADGASTPSADADTEGWETVRTAGNHAEQREFAPPTQQPTVSKSGWAKVDKGRKTKEAKPALEETDEWSTYARNLTNRRDAKKNVPTKKKKKADININGDEEDWD